jgi:hypothetical protein
MTKSSALFPKQEDIVSVVVISLMFLAVIAMVKKVEEDPQSQAILAPRKAEDGAGLQTTE